MMKQAAQNCPSFSCTLWFGETTYEKPLKNEYFWPKSKSQKKLVHPLIKIAKMGQKKQNFP